MKIYGVDFTSAPSNKKAITCAICQLGEDGLILQSLESLKSFNAFEDFLRIPGPWLTGIDFPFGQPRKLIENMGWPKTWEGYVSHISRLSKEEFVNTLAQYRNSRPKGDKQHLRQTDERANSRSPMMLFGVPVGKMFFAGAPLLRNSGAGILPCRPMDDPRLVIEAYPALVARRWIGNRSYKNDEVKKQTQERQSAREAIIHGLQSSDTKTYYGFNLHFSADYAKAFIHDGTGDQLDALLCAIQAGWAYSQREQNYGIPADCDPLEGWIVDPQLVQT